MMRRLSDWINRHELGIAFGILALCFIGLYLSTKMVHFVYAGQTGVLWHRLSGTELRHVYGEGMHVTWPWDDMFIYDARVQKVDRTVKLQSREGLDIVVDVTIRYNPVTKLMAALHQEVGPDYVETVVVPETVAALREVFGAYSAQAIYQNNPAVIQQIVTRRAAVAVRRRFMVIDQVSLRTITFPPAISAAIQHKLEEEQATLTYAHIIEREREEAKRKAIEAAAIVDFRDRVFNGNVASYLQWRGIQATLDLAKSPNSKVVIIGNSRDGMPLILNPDGAVTALPRPQ
jgi:regulator of protease activity HflC (stomatin/prohibitin superfamily)